MREFFDRPVLLVARDLLGAHLTVRGAGGAVTVRLTEVEAYDGAADPGSHAYRGRTARNATMFGAGGHLYVYRHLGLHHCANIVCGPEGAASGVLLRAAEVVDGVELARARRVAAGVVRADRDLARGPARLTVALGIDRSDDGADVAGREGRLTLEPRPVGSLSPDGVPAPGGRGPGGVRTGPRVGVSGDGGRADLFPWRFWLDGEPTVSDYRAAVPRRRAGALTRGSTRPPARR
ncbi:DNA-3-methyladenine glycosylase [Myceligenerans xiligouense]|uniref:Putative 3-methyladenine DNA glycosylase n=1 Tax=Myceligenerans xiligouense TaxID=253184 RepID=A0A3N4YLK3_9MICO|nr:DNA-3-methyladenine glycosylase [Myceligenerans xiligouense]RPF21979.1 DNA-3-methyladenine glycosylase [Myceligenerans xiligouense]